VAGYLSEDDRKFVLRVITDQPDWRDGPARRHQLLDTWLRGDGRYADRARTLTGHMPLNNPDSAVADVLYGLLDAELARGVNALAFLLVRLTFQSFDDEDRIRKIAVDIGGPAIEAILPPLSNESRSTATPQTHSKPASSTPSAIAPDPIRILHLSDLHFTEATPWKARLQWLIQDLERGDDLGPVGRIDYLVVSGDFTDRGKEAGFTPAAEFVMALLAYLNLGPESCILVPGNHDVAEPDDAYVLNRDVTKLVPGIWIQQGNIYLKRNPAVYPLRFEPFNRCLFEPVTGRPYPLEVAEQGLVQSFFKGAYGLQFVALNSCWELDEFDRKHSGILPDAVAHALQKLDADEREALRKGDLASGAPVLQIGVWHHPVTGHEMMADTVFVDNLRQHGVRIGLHGDVHELRRDQVGYWHPKKMHIVGVGSFGSPHEGLREATPRHYNLIEIAADFQTVTVHTRQQRRADGPWEGWYDWPPSNGGSGRVSQYTISLDIVPANPAS